eukprot:445995_1
MAVKYAHPMGNLGSEIWDMLCVNWDMFCMFWAVLFQVLSSIFKALRNFVINVIRQFMLITVEILTVCYRLITWANTNFITPWTIFWIMVGIIIAFAIRTNLLVEQVSVLETQMNIFRDKYFQFKAQLERCTNDMVIWKVDLYDCIRSYKQCKYK